MLFERTSRHPSLFGNRLSSASRIFLNVGLATSFGFRFFLDTLWKGGAVFFRGDSVENALQALDLHRVQAMISAPAGLAEFLEVSGKSTSFQSHLEIILS